MTKTFSIACLWLASVFASGGAESLVYKTAGDQALKIPVDKPSDWKSGDRRPAIVFFFGGWPSGGFHRRG